MTLVWWCMQSAYSASKAGLNALSEGMRRELKPFGIGVVIIAPGALKRLAEVLDDRTYFVGIQQC